MSSILWLFFFLEGGGYVNGSENIPEENIKHIRFFFSSFERPGPAEWALRVVCSGASGLPITVFRNSGNGTTGT